MFRADNPFGKVGSVDLEEELEQAPVGDPVRVEDDLDRLGVTRMVPVGRVVVLPTGVSDPGRNDSIGCSTLMQRSPPLTGRAGLPTRWSQGTTGQYFEQLDETLADLRVEIEGYRELGERVAALGVIRGAGKASHVEVANHFAVVSVVRNSRFVSVDTYNNWQVALEAAGLRE